MNTPSLLEDHISQIPALQELINLGYTYITPIDTIKQRKDKLAHVILEDILSEQLKKINGFSYKGKSYSFSDNNIKNSINALKDIHIQGVVYTG